MKVVIDKKKCCWKDGKCISCGCKGKCEGCVEVCPVEAIKRKSSIEVDYSKCILCGACVSNCKHKAISIK